ncbi:MAG: hypothetical protein A2X50_01485 [Candidatus Rokubacteria bacterium GWF2_70_14]|nr:MAG: hypothetical protein A2X50_01485 [Candidatus Rokubacteria bacterium GWF2_70_14]
MAPSISPRPIMGAAAATGQPSSRSRAWSQSGRGVAGSLRRSALLTGRPSATARPPAPAPGGNVSPIQRAGSVAPAVAAQTRPPDSGSTW